ncbi:adenosylmethionine-8-amino-7-oxononanoate aminotransferase [Candidatus Methylomirabilis lanthanidiphila]|uniref:Adenosylmethionine-8-amino-7-oxononanoate aminotransferase n=1 Tax=Candidatus Methylomirabilis lanthanidiphila TaxID=2211376 RepID=A0A564ZM12_9BACT|nr:aminotransferase class III-fold pyridoxal phosphate-dependent enzyme [Candidatus Methylomirabilis lanthanidiphila]VUZ86351.1 adenosylmethionine-8-amino-7-oxononanoate aminotransferase [Candidatus Methylomirabilis lanthanidiphila]
MNRIDKPRPTETALREKEAQYCSHGDTAHYSPTPKFFQGCEGSFLYDREDKPYLDLQMWYSTVNFGYRNRSLVEAVKAQLEQLPQLASQYLHEEKVLAAEKLALECHRAFGIKGRVHFNVGGAQAIEDSIKLVRSATSKSLFMAFMGGYHGRTLGASEITSSYRYRRRFGHFSNRAHFVPFPYCYRCPYDMKLESCEYYCVKQFERLFETEYNSFWDSKAEEPEFVAFYAEPVQATGGYIPPPPEYFLRLKKILDERKILLVDDEVQMGFFRTGKFWAIEHFGVKPNIVVFGKTLTNGLNPLSGLWADEALISPQAFPPGSTHSTYSSNPLGTAAALATLQWIEQQEYERKVAESGAYFLEQLEVLKKRHAVIGDVAGLGLALRIEVTQPDRLTPNQPLANRIFELGLAGGIPTSRGPMGLVLNVTGYYKNVFGLAPCLDITKSEIDLAIELLDWLFTHCTEEP